MEKRQIELKIGELKMDYIRVQSDIEKLESTGYSTVKAEKMLMEIEKELAECNSKLLSTAE